MNQCPPSFSTITALKFAVIVERRRLRIKFALRKATMNSAPVLEHLKKFGQLHDTGRNYT